MDMNELIAVAAAISACCAAIHQQRKRVKPKPRHIQPSFRRAALIHPKSTTAWRQLLSCGTSADFIVSINLDRDTFFNVLLTLFTDERASVNYGSPYRTKPKTRGRNADISTVDLLGLALWYVKSSDRQFKMGTIFGLVPSNLSVWIDYSLQVLLRLCVKKRHPDLRIEWPSESEMKESAELLSKNRRNGSLLQKIFGVLDGGRLPCADYTDSDVQNAFYEGYTTSVEVTNLFAFNFKGELIHAAVNFPGSYHDSRLANNSGLINPLLQEKTPRGYAILCDSAFTASKEVEGKIVRGRKVNERCDVMSEEMAAIDIILQRVLPSERQSAEWGIRAFKAPFGLLRLPMSADSEKRRTILLVCCHLLNLRTRRVGLNQIRTVYKDKDDVCQPWAIRFMEEQNRVSV